AAGHSTVSAPETGDLTSGLVTLSISDDIAAAVRSQDVPSRTFRIRAVRSDLRIHPSARAASIASTNCSGVSAMGTSPSYGSATSVMRVLTIGFSAAMYSIV